MLAQLVDPQELEDTVLSKSHYHRPAGYPRNEAFISQNKYEIPKDGLDEELTYDLISNDNKLDGNPTLNLASFVNTFVTDKARQLINENLLKNLADADEYPTLIDLTERNVSILGKLWHGTVPDSTSKPIGTATTGSSEAVMLGGLAMKKRWQAKRIEQGLDTAKPNILMGSNAQVALEKFARYFDVEARLIPVSAKSNHILDLTKIEENVDENTIGIFVILGSTYTGAFEDVKGVSKLLDKIHKEKGINVPIHVDAASGGFVAPFLFPDLEWDFRIKRVVSINTSGHKFGLTTAGLGWVIWRDSEHLPEDLIFKLRYLGSVEESFNLNFSRPGFQSIHQYYNFLHLGYNGYKDIHHKSLRNARLLSNYLEKSQFYECVSNIHRKLGDSGFEASKIDSNLKHLENDDLFFNKGLPVVAFKFTNDFQKEYPNIPQSLVSTLLRQKGWIIPNYPLPPSEEDTEILRVVVRYELTNDLLSRLVSDIINVTETLIKSSEYYTKSIQTLDSDKRSDYIYDVLSLIASGGTEDAELKTTLEKHHTEEHTTFKGTC